eukprot:CAMPEP_0176037516 /NCGR_PEP_ID=MMETSP0120_2-20121206/18586_1 /TAXON_ID=160619 /ORGANISM="Kryptoperidinium foliaceum, Strain CCMP 1326" /LENGTH=315 /DNA_ID=CAMNT_0017370905 /DNA_START=93 /DNA_END=1040 /DNA_ORIENTATION=+
MADIPKLNVAPFVTVPLALAKTGYQFVVDLMAKHAVADKLAAAKDHKVVTQAASKKELLMAVLGLVLVFHGAQFKNMLLCSQIFVSFLYDRVKASVTAAYSDIQTAQEKLQADQPDKSNAKKDGADKRKEDAEATTKALKALNSEKLSAAAVDILGAFMACVLVIQGGLAQKVAVANSFVNLVIDKVEALVEFPEHADIQAWTGIFVRLALYAVVLPLTFLSGSLALAMNAAACGAYLTTEHGVRFLASIGKVPNAEEFLGSKKGFYAVGGLIVIGTFWQFWSLTAGSGLGYFAVLYFPAIAIEAIIGWLAGASA